MRNELLGPLRSSSPSSDPRFARRWPASLAEEVLGSPLTSDEFEEAISRAATGHSPGPSGLPYELYKANETKFAVLLSQVFNEIWQNEELANSHYLAHIRLLFKDSKPGATKEILKFWRPIALRETDYKLLASVVVARLNLLLPRSIPASQHGFVKGRTSSDAATHLQFLIEEVHAQGLEEAVLLSLDQQSAYDLVDHDWILQTYEAYGAPPHFLKLLRAMYNGDKLFARYIVNGFLTTGTHLRCGFGQGDPASPPGWNLTFQPFVDELVRRKICLTLYVNPTVTTRMEVLTNLVFADDAILATESLACLPALKQLGEDWKLATNGQLNDEKTVATSLGPKARTHPNASLIREWTEDEDLDPIKWIGQLFHRNGNDELSYQGLLERLQTMVDRAKSRPLDLYSKAKYANTYILSKVLHLLSSKPAPPTFLDSFTSLIADFVWGGKYHPVSIDLLFRPPKLGGLGLLSPTNFDEANSLRFWDLLLSGRFSKSPPIWWALAVASFEREVLPFDEVWTVTTNKRVSVKHSRWKRLLATIRKYRPTFDLDLLKPSELLALPPALVVEGALPANSELASKYTELRTFENGREWLQTTYLNLWARIGNDPLASWARQPAWSEYKSGFDAALAQWRLACNKDDKLDKLTQNLILDLANQQGTALPNATPPRRSTFTINGLQGPFNASIARRSLVSTKPVHPRLPFNLESEPVTLFDIWRWAYSPLASARERETMWRLLLDATITQKKLHQYEWSESAACLHCGEEDTNLHRYFDCPWTAEYWNFVSLLLPLLISAELSALSLSYKEVLLGQARLTTPLTKNENRKLGLLVGIALQFIRERRQLHFKDGRQLPSPFSSAKIVRQRFRHRLQAHPSLA